MQPSLWKAPTRLLAAAGAGYQFPVPDVLLPVGISFFVFQSMSYTIDYYRGEVTKESNFLRYATFVSVFPQLVAGPIERASNLLPQLQHPPHIQLEDITDGMSMFVVGLFKKVALADYLSMYVDGVYSSPESHPSSALILATLAFAWQIYFDFSGYTDMARGIGRIIGLRLMLNFDNPYLATGLGDFWRRWHISLSSWFKDYVYVPLGGSRHGTLATYRNMASDDADLGTVARCHVDVCGLGCDPRGRSSPDARTGAAAILPRTRPALREATRDLYLRLLRVGVFPRREHRRRIGNRPAHHNGGVAGPELSRRHARAGGERLVVPIPV